MSRVIIVNTGSVVNQITRSVCPECLQTIEARIIYRDNRVFMQKTCPEVQTL